MYKYEFGHIIKCEGKKDEEIQKIIGEVRQMISDLNGRIVKEDVWGKQELAYPINKENHGFYMFTTMMMEPFQIIEFEKKLKLLDGSMRYLLINLDKEPGYAKQIAADESDDEKIKTRKPEPEDEEEKDKKEKKEVVKKQPIEEKEEVKEEVKEVVKEGVKEEVVEKKESSEEAKEEKEEEVEEKEEVKKDDKDEKQYDDLLDEKLSEIL